MIISWSSRYCFLSKPNHSARDLQFPTSSNFQLSNVFFFRKLSSCALDLQLPTSSNLQTLQLCERNFEEMHKTSWILAQPSFELEYNVALWMFRRKRRTDTDAARITTALALVAASDTEHRRFCAPPIGGSVLVASFVPLSASWSFHVLLFCPIIHPFLQNILPLFFVFGRGRNFMLLHVRFFSTSTFLL